MNDNMNAESSRSQTKRILEYLRDGHSITPLEALRMFSCFRLGARIAEISEIVGYKLPRKKVQVRNAEGKDVWVMQYSL